MKEILRVPTENACVSNGGSRTSPTSKLREKSERRTTAHPVNDGLDVFPGIFYRNGVYKMRRLGIQCFRQLYARHFR